MPRLPPVTITVRGPACGSSIVIVALAGSRLRSERVGARRLLGLAVELLAQRAEAVDEAVRRHRPREAQRGRIEMAHVELVAEPAGALLVEPGREHDADDRAGRDHPAQAPRSRRL